jgi:hypothetical protein
MGDSTLAFRKDDYADLPPNQQERFITGALRELIGEHPDGLARAELLKKVPFGRRTLDRHLIRLAALNEVRVEARGQTDVVYPNGRPVDEDAVFEWELTSTTLRVTFLRRFHDEYYVHIQTIDEDEYGPLTTGGILLTEDDFGQLLDVLEELQTESAVSEMWQRFVQ